MTIKADEALTQLHDATDVYLGALRRLRPQLEPYITDAGLLGEVVYDVDAALEAADGTPATIFNLLEEIRRNQR